MADKVALSGGGRGMAAAIARELSGRRYQLCLMSPSDSCAKLASELGGVAYQSVAERADDIRAVFDTCMTAYSPTTPVTSRARTSASMAA